MYYTIVLSGPARTLDAAEVALDLADVPILPADHHAHMGQTLPPLPSGKKTRTKQAFLTVEHDDINVPGDAVAEHGWVTRLYYATPEPPERPDTQDGLGALLATVEDMKREIAALRQKVGA